MCVADELCEELFCWLQQLDRCADHLMALAKELEEMTKAFTTGQLVANTTSVLGSLALVGTGVATLMTAGLAAPLMVAAGAGTIVTTASAATSLTLKLVEKWKSSKKMKDAECTIKKTAKTEDNIKRLQRKLTEECEAQGLKVSSSDEVQCEITVRLLTAMAKRSGKITGGVLGVALTIPDLFDNCKELIKNKHETEASNNLQKKAKEIHDLSTKLKNHLNEIQEKIKMIPESETETRRSSRQKSQLLVILVLIEMQYELQSESPKKKQKKQCILPRISMSNLQSLRNKIEELRKKVRNDYYFRSSDLMFFTETWLTGDSPNVELEGFTSCRMDRDPQRTKKTKGGGLIMYVRNTWAVKTVHRKNTPDYELMVVTISSPNHSEDNPPSTFIHTYVPGPDFDHAADTIKRCYEEALASTHAEQPTFALGDFNQCDLLSVLPGLEQYVTCLTRKDKILDKCYGNVPGAYRSKCGPPLSSSDHNVIHLIPKGCKSDKNDPSDDVECSHEWNS